MSWLNGELEKIGWSDSELARRCGVTPAAIYRLTKFGKKPSAKLARAIANALAPFRPEITQREVFTRAGLLDKEKGSVEPRILSKFTASWRKMPPELQRETEEFFGTITAEEFAELILDVIRIRRGRGKGDADAPDDDAPDEAAASSQRTKGRKQARLRPSGEAA